MVSRAEFIDVGWRAGFSEEEARDHLDQMSKIGLDGTRLTRTELEEMWKAMAVLSIPPRKPRGRLRRFLKRS